MHEIWDAEGSENGWGLGMWGVYPQLIMSLGEPPPQKHVSKFFSCENATESNNFHHFLKERSVKLNTVFLRGIVHWNILYSCRVSKAQNPLHTFLATSRCYGIWKTTRPNRHNRPAPTCYRLVVDLLRGSRQHVTDLLRGNWCNGFWPLCKTWNVSAR